MNLTFEREIDNDIFIQNKKAYLSNIFINIILII